MFLNNHGFTTVLHWLAYGTGTNTLAMPQLSKPAMTKLFTLAILGLFVLTASAEPICVKDCDDCPRQSPCYPQPGYCRSRSSPPGHDFLCFDADGRFGGE